MQIGSNENSAAPKCCKSVLLLQGPVGPFFGELEGALRAAGHSVRRVSFNVGDSLFSSSVHRPTRLSLTLDEWESWLKFELSHNTYDSIILFGSSRPAHKMARQIAELLNIRVLSLEEALSR